MILEIAFAVPGPSDDGVFQQEVSKHWLQVVLIQDRLHGQLVQLRERMVLAEVSAAGLVLKQQ